MKCGNCGAENSEDLKFCGDCGAPLSKQTEPQQRSRLRSEISLVVIALIVIGVVLISSIVVAFAYFSLTPSSQDGDDGHDGIPPAATYSKTPISGGQRINIVSITRTDVGWNDIRVQVSDGIYFWEWSTATADLDYGSAVTHDYGVRTDGGTSMFLNVTDVAGNGIVSGSDYFTVTADPGFSSGSVYVAVLIYEPTGERIGTGIAFTG